MHRVSVHEAKIHLSRLLRWAAAGEEVVITSQRLGSLAEQSGLEIEKGNGIAERVRLRPSAA